MATYRIFQDCKSAFLRLHFRSRVNRESKYEPIFDAALGSDRFASIDVIISSIGVTREEALSEIRYSEQQRTIANDLNSTTEAPFAYSAQNEVEYRWDIGSFDIYDYDFESNTKSLVLGFASFNNTAPLYQHFEEILAYAELNQLDNSYLATQLTTLIPGSDFAKVETAFTLTNYDDIFSYLTSGSVNGPELLDITVSPLQDIYVRLYSAIASAPLTVTPFLMVVQILCKVL